MLCMLSQSHSYSYSTLSQVKAYGKSIPPLHWLSDLHVSLSRLFGQFVSSLISAQTGEPFLLATIPPASSGIVHVDAVVSSDTHEKKKKDEQALLKSDLWRTVFRGGVIVGKLARSLSGAFVSHLTVIVPSHVIIM